MLDDDAVEALRLLSETLEEAGVSCTLVGALVPVIHVALGANAVEAKAARQTRDIDAAIGIDSWEDYQNVLEKLKAKNFNQRDSAPEHRLFYNDIEIDLLPAGQNLVSGDGHVIWPKSGGVLQTDGLYEALLNSPEVQLSSGLKMRLAPLWVFVIMKLIAYEDRTFRRDASDLVDVLKPYEEEGDRRFGAPDGTDYELAGAFICGQDILANAKADTVGLIIQILKENLANGEHSRIISDAIQEQKRLDTSEARREILGLFQALARGLGQIIGPFEETR